MGRALSVLDASVLIALLDEKDAGRPVARADVDESKRDHDLLNPGHGGSWSRSWRPTGAAGGTASGPRPRWPRSGTWSTWRGTSPVVRPSYVRQGRSSC